MLNSLVCSLHQKQVIKGCTKLDCTKNVLLCEQCSGTHSHNVEDINDFLQTIGSFVQDTLQRQKMEWKIFCQEEQNKQYIQMIFNKNSIEKFITKEIENFSNILTKQRQEFIYNATAMIEAKLKYIQNQEIEKFRIQAQRYKSQLYQISQVYDKTFKYPMEIYWFSDPLALSNKILSEENPEKYLGDIKQLKKIDLTELRNSIKEFNQIKIMNVVDFDKLLIVKLETLNKEAVKVQQKNIKDSSCEGAGDDVKNHQPIHEVPNLITQQSNPGSRDLERKLINSSHKIQRENSIIQNKPEKNISASQPFYDIQLELEQSFLEGKCVKYMIFLERDLIIYGTDTNLFQLKNQNQSLKIPVQFDFISYLEKLDQISFIVGGINKTGSAMLFKYVIQKNEFIVMNLLVLKGDFLTIVVVSKDCLAFVNTEKSDNKDIIYNLFYCKHLGVPEQIVKQQEISQTKKKRIKLFTLSENKFCLHIISEYIQIIQIKEEKIDEKQTSIFEEIKRVKCDLLGSVIPLINEYFLFSASADGKIENSVINLTGIIDRPVGGYVYQFKSDIFENTITVLQITEQGKLFLALVDKSSPNEIKVKELGQLNQNVLQQTPNYNILVHFIRDKFYIKDEGANSVKLYKIKFQK